MKGKVLLLSSVLVLILLIAITIFIFKDKKNSTYPGAKGKLMDSKELYQDGYNINMIVGIDQFGRSFEAVNGTKKGKDVGIFYFLWHGSDTLWEDAYDTSKILEEHGVHTLLYEDAKGVSPANQPHYWSEPIWGYYNTKDKWVLYKQMELLTQAGG